tara:strand:- start:245 stop:1039 length:795 start_codon:yes stop_codon:yes gene_type:complete
MSNSTLSNKLAGFINSQMTDFLSVIAKDYKINETEILDKWSSFTGIKKKTSKPKSTGPNIIELRQKLKGLGLKSSGKKSDLEDRLAAFEAGELKPETAEDKKQAVADGDYSKLTIKELKAALKAKGHKTSGKKEELIKRMSEPVPPIPLGESDNDDSTDYNKWTVKKIKETLKSRGIKSKVGDKKEDLIKRLNDDDAESDNTDSESSDSDSESELDSDCCSGCSDNECDGCGSDSDSDVEEAPKRKESTWTKKKNGKWGPTKSN